MLNNETRTTNIELYCETMKCLKHLVDTTVTLIQSLEETKHKNEPRTYSKPLNEAFELVNEESHREKSLNSRSKAISYSKSLNFLISKISSKKVEVLLYESFLSKRPHQLQLSSIFHVNFYDLIVILAHAFKLKSQRLDQNVKKPTQSRTLSPPSEFLQLNVRSELSDSRTLSFSYQVCDSLRLSRLDKLVQVRLDSEFVDIDCLKNMQKTELTGKVISINHKKQEDEDNISNLEVLNRHCLNKKIKKSDSFLVPDITRYETVERRQIKHYILAEESNVTKRDEIEATQPFEFVPFTQNFDCSHLFFSQTQLNCSQLNNLDQVQLSQTSSLQKCHSNGLKDEDQENLKNSENDPGQQNIEDVRKEELVSLIDEKISPNQFIEFVPIQSNETANQQDQLVPIIFTQCGTRIDVPACILIPTQAETTSTQLVPKSNEPNHENERTKALKRRLFMRLGLSKKQKIRKHLHPSFD